MREAMFKSPTTMRRTSDAVQALACQSSYGLMA